MKKIKIVVVICLSLVLITPSVFAGLNILKVWDTFYQGTQERWQFTETDEWYVESSLSRWTLTFLSEAPFDTYGTAIASDSSTMRGGAWHYVGIDAGINGDTWMFGTIFGYTGNSIEFFTVSADSDGNIEVNHYSGDEGPNTIASFEEGLATWASAEENFTFAPGQDWIVKVVYNPYNGTLRWKIWNLDWATHTPEIEPFNWTIDMQNDSLIRATNTKWGLIAERNSSTEMRFGNFHIFDYKYETETDDTPYMRSPETTMTNLAILNNNGIATYQDIVNAMSSAWTSSFYYDQDPSHPNDTILITTAWNRTSQIPLFANAGMLNDWLTFNVQVTPDISFDNDSGVDGEDWCEIVIDKNNTGEWNTGDIYFMVNATGNSTENLINGTWFVHEGDTWIEQQTIRDSWGDVILFFESDIDTDKYDDEDLILQAYNDCVGFATRQYASSPLRAESYEQWFITLDLGYILPTTIDNFITSKDSIGINLYGYGTLAPRWSWSQWYENNETWYNNYQSECGDPAIFGNLYLTGNLLPDEYVIDYIDLSDTTVLSRYGVEYYSYVWTVPRYALDTELLVEDNITKFKVPTTVNKEFFFGLFKGTETITEVKFYGINIADYKINVLSATSSRTGDNYTLDISDVEDYDIICVILNPSYLDTSNWLFKSFYKKEVAKAV